MGWLAQDLLEQLKTIFFVSSGGIGLKSVNSVPAYTNSGSNVGRESISIVLSLERMLSIF